MIVTVGLVVLAAVMVSSKATSNRRATRKKTPPNT